MPRSNPRTLTARSRIFGAPQACLAMPEPTLTEKSLADPDTGFDAAMDYCIPRDASPPLLRQAERCLLGYIAWLQDEAMPQHRSWANDEIQRAVRRVVEVRTAAKAARARLH